MAAKDPELATDLIRSRSSAAGRRGSSKAMTQEGRTLVITQNGKAAAVVMSPREYDALRNRQRFVEEVARGLADVEAGRVQITAQLRNAMRKRRKSEG